MGALETFWAFQRQQLAHWKILNLLNVHPTTKKVYGSREITEQMENFIISKNMGALETIWAFQKLFQQYAQWKILNLWKEPQPRKWSMALRRK